MSGDDDKILADNAERARAQSENFWPDRLKEFGLPADAVVATVMHGVEIPGSMSIENATKIPADMIPYIDTIFAERDRLAEGAMEKAWIGEGEFAEAFKREFHNKVGATREEAWPILNGLILPKAIENVRNNLKGATNGTAAPSEN